ncbi:MAG TPA: glycosyltransferase [Pasteurellaceae bacterium]|nr:glycosyltransferase [Pasteurellaceae bacterium]
MFSIIVPSYNRNAEITALLESLAQQTVQNFDVVIVDDCSQNPVEIDRTFSFPVQVIRNAQNAGPADSRNIGARHAQHDWLLFLDDDDRFATDKCQILEDVIARNPTINFIYHPAECLMVNENFTYFTHPYTNIADLTIENMLLANKIGGMPMIGIKKDLFFKVNGLSTELKSLEDYDFVLKVVTDDSFVPRYIDKPLTKCTFHTKRSSVSTNTENTEKAISHIQRTYVKTEQQAQHFQLNSLYMLAYPNLMNLSRKAAKYYFEMFKCSRNIKYLIITIITLMSPKLVIHLKRLI